MKLWHIVVVLALVAALYWWKTQKDKPSANTTSVSKQPGNGPNTAVVVDDVSKAISSVAGLFSSISGSGTKTDPSNSSLAPGSDTSSPGTSSIMGDAPPDATAAGQADMGNPLFDQTNYA